MGKLLLYYAKNRGLWTFHRKRTHMSHALCASRGKKLREHSSHFAWCLWHWTHFVFACLEFAEFGERFSEGLGDDVLWLVSEEQNVHRWQMRGQIRTDCRQEIKILAHFKLPSHTVTQLTDIPAPKIPQIGLKLWIIIRNIFYFFSFQLTPIETDTRGLPTCGFDNLCSSLSVKSA